MGYTERSIRQLQNKFQKQAKIKRQKSVQSILDAENVVASYLAQKLEGKLKLYFKELIVIHKEK